VCRLGLAFEINGKNRGVGRQDFAQSEKRASMEEKLDSALLSLHVFSIP
jgi:hypothetical protein